MDSTDRCRSPLARLREHRGLTQRDLAERIGLQNPASVSALETGKDVPSLELALRIQVWADGEVQAGELRPDDAQLLDDAARTHRLRPAPARTTPAEAAA